ncbi:hypothetical protein IQ07DRAFT_203313 [Pyrenochaeta sp. DS3sAY3a]|nr:hypothetical protein IQ07DRAFT_203313 [Pyrenochaeta sp. DS3sAY3a]
MIANDSCATLTERPKVVSSTSVLAYGIIESKWKVLGTNQYLRPCYATLHERSICFAWRHLGGSSLHGQGSWRREWHDDPQVNIDVLFGPRSASSHFTTTKPLSLGVRSSSWQTHNRHADGRAVTRVPALAHDPWALTAIAGCAFSSRVCDDERLLRLTA